MKVIDPMIHDLQDLKSYCHSVISQLHNELKHGEKFRENTQVHEFVWFHGIFKPLKQTVHFSAKLYVIH